MNLVYYSQKDQRWRNIMYSNHGNKSQTIGTSACGPTCFAMVASSFRDKQVLPPEAATYAVNRGFRTNNDGTAWGYFANAAKAYGLECRETGSLDESKRALAADALVIVSMAPGHLTKGGHYVLLTGIKGKWIDVYDPNHNYPSYGNDGLVDQGVKDDGKIKVDEVVFRLEARRYWIFPRPVKSEEDKPMTKEEKEAFDALRDEVAAIKLAVEAAMKLNLAPKWFISEFGSADAGGLINDSRMTSEGWRTIAIALRAQGMGNGKK